MSATEVRTSLLPMPRSNTPCCLLSSFWGWVRALPHYWTQVEQVAASAMRVRVSVKDDTKLQLVRDSDCKYHTAYTYVQCTRVGE